MEIEKAYFALSEILERWSIAEDDLIYLAENDEVRLSIRVFGLPLEFGDFEEDVDGRPFRIPTDRLSFSGVVDLHARDVFQLFRCGEAHIALSYDSGHCHPHASVIFAMKSMAC